MPNKCRTKTRELKNENISNITISFVTYKVNASVADSCKPSSGHFECKTKNTV